nr:uncharacterized protein LOC129164633 [Nothobranchius furzeri]
MQTLTPKDNLEGPVSLTVIIFGYCGRKPNVAFSLWSSRSTLVSRSEVHSCGHSLSLEFSLCRWACLEVNQAAADLLISRPGVFKQLRDFYTSLDDYSTWVPSKPPLSTIVEPFGPFEIFRCVLEFGFCIYPSCSCSPDKTSTFISYWLNSGTPIIWNSNLLVSQPLPGQNPSSCPPKLPGSPQTQLPPRLTFWISVPGKRPQLRPDHSSLKLVSSSPDYLPHQLPGERTQLCLCCFLGFPFNKFLFKHFTPVSMLILYVVG